MQDRVPNSKFPYQCQPNCSVYDTARNHNNNLNSSLIKLVIEFKTGSDSDPFVDPRLLKKSKVGDTFRNPFMVTSSKAQVVAGQIIAYATLVLSAQYHTHVFLVLVFKEYSRLIHWDCGGAVVTAPISHTKDPHLLDFLIHFNNAGTQARGWDITVTTPSPAEETAAWTVHELRGNIPLVKLSISDPSQLDETNHYITGVPFSRSDILACCWTRTSITYDVERQQRILLKDSWRVIFLDITPEGEIYKRLNRNSVPNIPLYFWAGDVGDSNFHAFSTHKFNDEYGSPCVTARYLEQLRRAQHLIAKSYYDLECL